MMTNAQAALIAAASVNVEWTGDLMTDYAGQLKQWLDEKDQEVPR